MRIAHLTSTGELGGAETSVLEMIGSIRTAFPAWRQSVVAPAAGPFLARLQAADVPAAIEPFPPLLERVGEVGRADSSRGRAVLLMDLALSAPAVLAYRTRLRRALASPPAGPVDIVHAHGLKMHVFGAMAKGRDVRLIWHLHDYVSGRPASAWLLKRYASRCSAIVANSHSVAADVRRVCGASPPVHVVYNAVDLARFSPAGNVMDLAAAAGVSAAAPGTLRVGLVATFGRWKGHRTFLRAVKDLPRDLPVRAYIVGGSVYRTNASQETLDELRRHAEDLGVADRVAFTGAVTDVPAVLRALDVVVHASTAPEPFGMVIAEAMACGRPLIASLAGGAAELVSDGVDGLGHAPGDAGQLSACIARLAGDPGLRARLGAAARETAVRRFDAARLATELAPIYQGASR